MTKTSRLRWCSVTNCRELSALSAPGLPTSVSATMSCSPGDELWHLPLLPRRSTRTVRAGRPGCSTPRCASRRYKQALEGWPHASSLPRCLLLCRARGGARVRGDSGADGCAARRSCPGRLRRRYRGWRRDEDRERAAGATDAIDSSATDAVAALREMVPEGLDYVFDAIGKISTTE